MRARFDHLFSEATGQSKAQIAQDTQRDIWLTTDAAIRYGLVHKVIERIDELEQG